jgi:hypothetical protein
MSQPHATGDVTIRSAKWPDSYLRICDENGVAINCSDQIIRFEMLLLKPNDDGRHTITGTGLCGEICLSVNPTDGKLGIVESVGPNEKFDCRSAGNNTWSFESNAKPGWYLRMDASGPHDPSDGYGVVSVQNDLGDDGIFFVDSRSWA